MSQLLIRRLLVDLETPVPRHWCGGDAFRTAYFNALSMCFPTGEQFFLDSVKMGMAILPENLKPEFEDNCRGFIGQESMHRALHVKFNQHLEDQGHTNIWDHKLKKWRKSIENESVQLWLGATAASEHFTAMLADYILKRPHLFGEEEKRLCNFWMWHASEETEHKCLAFDLFRALGGDEKLRARTYAVVTRKLILDCTIQTIRNLWHDKMLFRFSTLKSAASFFLGSDGMARNCFKPWRLYWKKDFNPLQLDSTAGLNWLATNTEIAVPTRKLAKEA